MSRGEPPKLPDPSYVPLIALVFRLNRLFQQDMVEEAARRGHTELKASHNSVFATLDAEGGRPSEMAAQAGITRQSMGEIIRDMVRLGHVEMGPDPADRRAKIVTWTERGLANAREGFGHIREMEVLLAERLGQERYDALVDGIVEATRLLEEQAELRRSATDVRTPR